MKEREEEKERNSIVLVDVLRERREEREKDRF